MEPGGPPAAEPASEQWLTPLVEELPLGRVIADRLASAIVQGALAPGERLNEEELAQRFQTSRTPVREALRLLEREALVTFAPRRGVRVSEVSLDDAAELYLCRGYLAGLAARLATENATPEEIDSLRTLQGVAEDALVADNREQYVRRAFEFDDLLIAIARNQLLTQLLAQLQRGSLRLSISLSMPAEVLRASMQTRRDLLKAIDARKPAEAERLMRRMISLTWDALAEAGIGSGDAGGAQMATGGLLRDT